MLSSGNESGSESGSESEGTSTSKRSKIRKSNYIPVRKKKRFREVVRFLKDMNEQEECDSIESGKLCEDCKLIVLKEITGCSVCGEIVKDARLASVIEEGWNKELAMEERVCFQGSASKREPNESDKSCFCCQKRIMDIIHEEQSGNTMKLKVVFRKSRIACIVCNNTDNLKDFNRIGRMYIQTG